MKDNNQDQSKDPIFMDEFLKGAKPPYSLSKEEVWERLENKISKKDIQKKTFSFRPVYAIAASIAILIGVGTFMRFYSTNLEAGYGSQLSHVLPDGSILDVNSGSTISYHPYWWRFSRKIQFEGEAFFNVEKGKKFQVISNTGTTEVIGTSFNVYSRENIYNVQCITGKVKVSSEKSDETAILNPNEKAILNPNGSFEIRISEEPNSSDSWKNNYFYFTSMPINLVFNELERQYNIVIYRPANLEFTYTGNFAKEKSPEYALNLICKVFGLNFERKSEKEFVIENRIESE